MFGSIFIGLSGMKAFSTGLKQISHNITNINTTGFKASRISFTDMFGAGGARGGQGVAIDAPRIDFAQGELRQSERDLDLAIEGDGFLVLLKDADAHFARTGSFEINEDGDIVLAGTEYKLTVLDASGVPTPVSVAAHRMSAPQATTTVNFADNLSSSATSFTVSNIKVFDAQGISETWSAKFERAADAPAGEWQVIVTSATGGEVGRKTLKFIAGIVDPSTNRLNFTAGARSVDFDFSGNVTSFSHGEVSNLRVSEANGYGAGEITALKVNDKGELEITYSNEQKHVLGAVALATFENPEMLEQRGGGLFIDDGRAGGRFTISENEKVGRVLSNRLEAANVELSDQFGDLILVQRGFQASSQVVSVSNDMIQQLFGMRGQG